MLEKLGLVEKIVATPILYNAIPLKEGTSRLFQEKAEEHTQLETKVQLLFESDDGKNNGNIKVQDDCSEFIITSERKRFVKRVEKSFSEATTCDVIFPGKGLNFVMFSFFECFNSAVSRGVKIRLITQKTEISLSVERKIRSLIKNPLFEMKLIDSMIDYGIMIFNNAEVNICIAGEEVPSLWTNNYQVIRMAQIIFETQWNAHPDFLLLNRVKSQV